MRKTKIIYWIVTGLFSIFMIWTAVPNVMLDEQSVEMIGKGLGFPNHFIVMIGYAKIAGSIAILIPGFPKLKEWAYAGLFFDLVGATWAGFATMPEFNLAGLIMLMFIGWLFLSYFYYHKLMEETNQPVVN